MNSLEANKIVGAGLGVVFLMFGGSLVAEGIFHSEPPETPGYEVAVAEPEEGGAGAVGPGLGAGGGPGASTGGRRARAAELGEAATVGGGPEVAAGGACEI